VDWRDFFDEQRDAPDKTYSRWGGFIDDVAFDPIEFGMPPNSLSSIDPLQLLALKATKDALADSGYSERSFDRSRTSVIIAAGGGFGDLGNLYCIRSELPVLFGQQAAALLDRTGKTLPEWTEDSFPEFLPMSSRGE